ncbi:MAG: DUF1902 domain-containing protein [Clostridiales bacterium]|nr:DUF1902 domain-containing protein [Clostridiales bacterium]
MELKIIFAWDDGIWYTKTDFGLTLESGSFDALVERVRVAVPELVELNYGYTGDIQLLFEIERSDSVKVTA